jgi:hypothetical protein
LNDVIDRCFAGRRGELSERASELAWMEGLLEPD